MKRPSVEELVHELKLQPHPEGGYFRETYRAAENIPHAALPRRFTGERAYATAIYFLLPEGKFSALHRIQADEVWHFYLGGPLTVVQIAPAGKVEHIILGPDLTKGHTLQHVVPAGHWFGAYPNTGSEYSLVGCTASSDRWLCHRIIEREMFASCRWHEFAISRPRVSTSPISQWPTAPCSFSSFPRRGR